MRRRAGRPGSGLGAAAADSSTRWIELGYVAGTHGLRGTLRVKQHNPDSELLSQQPELALRHEGRLSIHAITDVRATAKGLLVQLHAVDSVEAAEALRGAVVCLPRALLPELPAGEYYHVDLEGLRVETASGAAIGVVERVLEYPASQVLCVRADDGVREVPMREPYLLEVELEQGRVLIDHWDELPIEK